MLQIFTMVSSKHFNHGWNTVRIQLRSNRIARGEKCYASVRIRCASSVAQKDEILLDEAGEKPEYISSR
jgi:hypothetical protein